MKDIKPFTTVEIKSKKGEYKGILLPPENGDLLLKLDSGYVITLEQKSIKEINQISKPKTFPSKKINSTNFDKESITIIQTGGTISSKVDYKTGAVIASFDADSLLSLFPELKNIAKIESQFIGNIMSDNFRLHDFNLMAEAIHKRALKGQRKFIVTSGTDFLHYVSAALSFLLKDVQVKVIVVGSQRSSDRPSSDAAQNLINAAYFLQNKDFTGVFACMHSNSSDGDCNILPGLNLRKMHSSRRDAFKAINGKTIAITNYDKKEITMLKDLTKIIQKEIPKKIPLFKENLKIGLIQSHPQFFAKELDSYDTFNGLILSGSGFGHFPILESDENSKEHKKIFSKIKVLAKKMPVVMSTQTISGSVNLNIYSPLRMLQDVGVIGHLSTTITETAFIKLAYLLSTTRKSDIKTLFESNLLGENDPENYFSFEETQK